MTLVEQEQLEGAARHRRIQRERIESQISAVEQRISSLDRGLQEKRSVVAQLRKLEAIALELPPQTSARRSMIASGGYGSSTIPCVRSELISVLAGAIGSQEVRLTNLEERREADVKLLAQLRAGVKEFSEAGA